MKVLHVNEHYGSVGGTERYLAEICAALAKRGWDPVVVASSTATISPAPPAPRIYRLVSSYGFRSTRRALAPLRHILESERPDLVHLHNTQYFLGPSLLNVLQSRAPVVQTVHDTRMVCPRWQSKIIPSAATPCHYRMGTHCFRHGCYPFHRSGEGVAQNLQKFLLVGWQLASLRRLDRLLVPSAYIHEQLRLNGVPAARLETLPLFLRADFVPPARPAATRRIVYAGRVEESKGMRYFLDCLARLSALPWTAQVAGDGPFLAEARAIAARQGLDGRVEFLGQLPWEALARVLGHARLVVMPSLMPESFGLSGLEALACGAPVVAFDAGGITEWLADGVTGFVVPWGDATALAARVRQLLEDDLLAATLSRQSREHARRFDLDAHMDRLCGIYAEVTARHHRSAKA